MADMDLIREEISDRVLATDNPPDVETSDVDGAMGLAPREVKRNMKALISLDAIWAMGWNDIQRVLTPLLIFLKASDTMLGVVGSASFMALIGVFLSPWITRRFRYKKWYLYGVNVPYMGTIAMIGVLAVIARRTGISDHTLLWSVFGLVLLQWMIGGFCGLPNQEYIAACIPKNSRGSLVGYSTGIAGLGSIGALWVAERVMKIYPEPLCFGLVFLMGAMLCQGGFTFALFAKETPSPIEKSPKPWSMAMLKSAWNDKPYVRALTLVFLSNVLVGPAFTFIDVYGMKGLKMAFATSAIMGIVAQVVRIVFSPVMGRVTDTFTPKRLIPYLYIIAAAAYLPAIVLHNAIGVYIGIGLYILFWAGSAPCFISMLFGLPSPQNRSGHYTLQILVQNLAGAIGPVTVGVLLDRLPSHVLTLMGARIALTSYHYVFVMGTILALLFIPFSKYMLRTLDMEALS